jgi:hypothetical protein
MTLEKITSCSNAALGFVVTMAATPQVQAQSCGAERLQARANVGE